MGRSSGAPCAVRKSLISCTWLFRVTMAQMPWYCQRSEHRSTSTESLPKTGEAPERVEARVRSKSKKMRVGRKCAARHTTCSPSPRENRQSLQECVSHLRQRCWWLQNHIALQLFANGQRPSARAVPSHSQHTPLFSHNAEKRRLQWLHFGRLQEEVSCCSCCRCCCEEPPVLSQIDAGQPLLARTLCI